MKYQSLAEHIALAFKATKDALAFIKDSSKEQFINDGKTQHAVSMCLIILGQFAGKMLLEQKRFVKQHPEIPWEKMVDQFAFKKQEIDFHAVWDASQNFLPEFFKNIERIKSQFQELETDKIQPDKRNKIDFDEW